MKLRIFMLFAVAMFFISCERKIDFSAINTNDKYDIKITQSKGDISNIDFNNGKISVINFFTSTCGACKEELPSLVQLNNTYKAKVNFIGVLGEKIDKNEALKFINSYHINYPVVNKSTLVKILSDAVGGVFGIPVTIIYDKNGKLIKKLLGIVPKSTLEKIIKDNI